MEYYNKYYEGEFWLPDQETKIQGVFYIDEKGNGTISSTVAIDGVSSNSLSSWGKIDYIYGYIRNINDPQLFSVILLDSYKGYLAHGNINRYKYNSRYILIAREIDKNISFLCRSLMLRIKGIESWIPVSGLKYQFGDESSNFKLDLHYTQPSGINIYNSDKFDIYFYFRAKGLISRPREFTCRESVFFNIDFNEELSIYKTFSIRKTFERLFTLLLFEQVDSYEVEITSNSKSTYTLLQIILESKSANFFRVPVNSFLENSENIIKKWLFLQEELDLLIRGFFNAYQSSGLLAENKFLNYIAGLEFYYKKRYTKYKRLEPKLKFLLTNSIFKEHIKDKVNYSQLLMQTRHHLAHFDSKYTDDEIFNAKELIYVNKVLEHMIREILLNEIELKGIIRIPKNFKIK